MSEKSDSQLPTQLYKYQAFTTQSLTNLVNRQIWLSSPLQFNDPFDCTADVDVKECSEEDLEEILKHTKNELRGDTHFDVLYRTDGKLNSTFRSAISSALRAETKKVMERRSEKGLACFSEVHDNMLMWAHYGDGHRGFCLQFDTSYAPLTKALKVAYQSEVPQLDGARVLIGDAQCAIRPLYLTKLTDWSYEQEWRVIHQQAKTAFGYGVDALTGIYFGSSIDASHREILALVLRGSPTKLYQMERVPHEFAVEAKPVEHQPYDYMSRKDARSVRK